MLSISQRNNFTQQNLTDSRYNSYMQKLRKVNTDNYTENFILQNAISKSPIRRNNLHAHIAAKSPIRSRALNLVSPIKASPQLPMSVRLIANVSPLRERPLEQDNHADIGNVKHVKYIQQGGDRRSEILKKEMSGKTERVTLEENRLFGKIVNKINSEKKNPRSNEGSYRTSIFAENTDPKLKTDGFKHFSNQLKIGETRSQLLPNTENNNLSCLIYRMRSNSRHQQVENHQASSMSRKPSKLEELPVQQQEEDYTEFNLLLQKAAVNIPVPISNLHDEEVRQSLRVMSSLNMDPFL